MDHVALIEALRATARRLEKDADYRWTHMGRCNCGHLAQTITGLSAAEIHSRAMARAGDWSQQARTYRPRAVCPTSGYPMDEVLDALLLLGLTRDDIHHLERLSDARILRRLPAGERDLDRRRRTDVVRYLRTWADAVEERWMQHASFDLRTLEPVATNATSWRA
ncbi:MAG: hypothetical protein AAGN46_11110 [Acidobacteriota bacterium]